MSSSVSAVAPTPRVPRPVRVQERALDIAAALFLGAGVLLFGIARRALGQLANGTYDVPAGVLFVTRADFHAAQSRVGLWLVGAGLVVGAIAALQHFRRRRRGDA
jgi:hypothetical protein